MNKAILLGLLLVPGAAWAADAGDKPGAKPGAMICRDVGETGSRLGTKRVCMSRDTGTPSSESRSMSWPLDNARFRSNRTAD